MVCTKYLHLGNKLGMNLKRKSYPSDVGDEEWSFCVSYLTLMEESAPQRVHSLREIFNALRYLVKTGEVWRRMPHDLPPWHVVYQQTRRWIKAGCFEAMAHDLRAILRLALERKADPSAVIWTAASCSRRRRAKRGRALTDIRNAKAPKCMRPWTRWVTCWRWR
jgi:transposase